MGESLIDESWQVALEHASVVAALTEHGECMREQELADARSADGVSDALELRRLVMAAAPEVAAAAGPEAVCAARADLVTTVLAVVASHQAAAAAQHQSSLDAFEDNVNEMLRRAAATTILEEPDDG